MRAVTGVLAPPPTRQGQAARGQDHIQDIAPIGEPLRIAE